MIPLYNEENMNMPELSVVIITFNEERNIAQCLESVKGIADEIVIVDSFSTDKTKEIALSYGVQFIEHAFEGHIQQKNWAAAQSTFPHVLSLDADEVLSEELTQSIIEVKNCWDADGYSFNRLTNYCGSWIRHGSWYPDVKLRLWDRRKGKWGGMNPHDCYEMENGSKIRHLKGDLFHYSYYAISDHTKQVEKFTEITAKVLFDKGKKASLSKLVFGSTIKFFRDYFLKAGFLDGYAGYQIAKISAYATFLKYARLRDLHRNAQGK